MSNQPTSFPFHLRAIRAALRRLNAHGSRRYDKSAARRHPMPALEPSVEVAAFQYQLRDLDLPSREARAYFEQHMPRLARTLSLVPPTRSGGRILEMGCYLQITPFLSRLRGYREVRGADRGVLGQSVSKTASVGGKAFAVVVDLFDAERDRFPYEDGYFETVLVCELIEHLLYDPSHLLLECHRVLEEGGRVLVTTPNAASFTSVARVLHGYDNPQLYSKYTRPRPDAPAQVPHVREYTAFELQYALRAAGFEMERVFTEPIIGSGEHLPMWNFLEEHGYNTALRGEQTYCVAIKRSGLPVTRYPEFLYSD